MSGQELAQRTPPDRGMQLGVRRKPQLRLALGYRDENRKGAPVKTDYFIPHGNDAAVAKFVRTYGETPRAVDIRLPGSLGQFLEIKHVAFAGGQNGEGGILKAIGAANFALEGVRGGPDVLTVFDVVDRKLSVEEVEIDGVDDPVARGLGVQLRATATFGIPDVLGFGGVCEISSRGKETMDTLWESAADIYGQLGPLASMILRPKLIVKESRMLTPAGTRAQVFVLDLYVPESLDEIMARAREHRELLPARASAASMALYDRPLEIEAAEEGSPSQVSADAASPGGAPDGPAGSGRQAEPSASPSPPEGSAPDSFTEGEPSDAQRLADSAGQVKVPARSKPFGGQTVAEAHAAGADVPRADGVSFFSYALDPARAWAKDSHADHLFYEALRTYCAHYLPELGGEQVAA